MSFRPSHPKGQIFGLRGPERADFRPERADFRPQRADSRPERAWGEQWDGRMDKQKYPCVLQDFAFFGAAAQRATFMTVPTYIKKDLHEF